jgi:hypothetical protein
MSDLLFVNSVFLGVFGPVTLAAIYLALVATLTWLIRSTYARASRFKSRLRGAR